MTERSGPNLTLRRLFSRRERAIAEMIGDGKSYAEIGQTFSPALSPHTVRSYVTRMAQKIDVEMLDRTNALPPRMAVQMLVMHERWEKSRQPQNPAKIA